MLKAKLWGALNGLQFAWDTRYRNIILGIDSSLVMQLLTKNDYCINAHTTLILYQELVIEGFVHQISTYISRRE